MIPVSTHIHEEMGHDNSDHPKKSADKYRKNTRIKDTMSRNVEIVFGFHPVFLALKAKRRKLIKLLVKNTQNMSPRLQEIVNLAKMLDVPVKSVSATQLDFLTGNRVHQGICLKAGQLQIPLLDESQTTLFKNSSPSPDVHDKTVWLLLNQVHDPMNLGGILRSAYYLGIDRVLGTSEGNCRLSTVVSKASSGILEIIDFNYVRDIEALIMTQKSKGWDIIGTCIEKSSSDTEKVVHINHFSLRKPSLLIIGNEGTGLDEKIMQQCTCLLTIPQINEGIPGMSLNVSVAAGIILHSLVSKS